jgi:hypothetical protein
VKLPTARCHIEGQPTACRAVPGDGGGTKRLGAFARSRRFCYVHRSREGASSLELRFSILRSPVAKEPDANLTSGKFQASL